MIPLSQIHSTTSTNRVVMSQPHTMKNASINSLRTKPLKQNKSSSFFGTIQENPKVMHGKDSSLNLLQTGMSNEYFSVQPKTMDDVN